MFLPTLKLRQAGRLPSLAYILEHAREAWRRFPYVLVCAFLAAAVSITLIEAESSDFWFTKLLMTLGLGIPLFFSFALFHASTASSVAK